MCDEVHLTVLVSGIFVVVIIILSGFLLFFLSILFPRPEVENLTLQFCQQSENKTGLAQAKALGWSSR